MVRMVDEKRLWGDENVEVLSAREAEREAFLGAAYAYAV
jgi:hypothetical protein